MAYHGYYNAPNPLGEHPMLCVDVWRIENGKIKEHWDALCPLPEEQLNRMLAGEGNGEASVTAELRHTNKATVRRFLDQVLNRGRLSEIDRLVLANFVYHHEQHGELKGQDTLRTFLENAPGGRMPHDNKLLLASGDLVMAHSLFFGEPDRVGFDWFRLEIGQIAEHWSVEQPISPWEEVANEHPHF